MNEDEAAAIAAASFFFTYRGSADPEALVVSLALVARDLPRCRELLADADVEAPAEAEGDVLFTVSLAEVAAPFTRPSVPDSARLAVLVPRPAIPFTVPVAPVVLVDAPTLPDAELPSAFTPTDAPPL